MIEITLPFPPKHCWPNSRSRSHWPSARDKKKARQWAWAAAMEVLPPCFKSNGEPIQIKATLHPKPKGPAPDGDNVNAACKAYFDGIADALNVNDRLFCVAEPEFAERVPGGKVVVRI